MTSGPAPPLCCKPNIAYLCELAPPTWFLHSLVQPLPLSTDVESLGDPLLLSQSSAYLCALPQIVHTWAHFSRSSSCIPGVHPSPFSVLFAYIPCTEGPLFLWFQPTWVYGFLPIILIRLHPLKGSYPFMSSHPPDELPFLDEGGPNP